MLQLSANCTIAETNAINFYNHEVKRIKEDEKINYLRWLAVGSRLKESDSIRSKAAESV